MVGQGAHLGAASIIADANYRNLKLESASQKVKDACLGLFDQLDEFSHSPTIARRHPIHLVHDQQLSFKLARMYWHVVLTLA